MPYQFDLEKVIKDNGIESLVKKAELVEPNLKENINQIIDSYSTHRTNCDAIAQQVLMSILRAEDLKKIHSARYRVKAMDSLAVKIIKKKAELPKEPSNIYDIEKYRNLNKENYYKVLMDLTGIRILIRYRTDWLTVHKWIRNQFYKGNEHYVKDCLEDYDHQPQHPFIAEKPKLYYRSKKDLVFYKQIDRDFFDFIESEEGYNSLHYIINNDGKYIEIQVRTIFDEAWSECTHDLVYKNKNKEKESELKYLSQCLAQQTISAELIANMMYIKANDGDDFDSVGNMVDTLNMDYISESSEEKNGIALGNIKDRIEKLNKNRTGFDGNIQNYLM